MKKIKIVKYNFRRFGFKYIYYDALYHFFNRIHFLFKKPYNLKGSPKIIDVNNYKMYVNKNGAGIHKDLLINHTREVNSTKTMTEWIKKGDTVLDLGANIGYYTVLFSKLVGNNGKVYAIEPTSDNLEYLEKNIKLNNLKNVELTKAAIGDTDGKLNIYISDNSGNYNTPNYNGSNKKETVKSYKLDTFFKDKVKPKILKMDIEGYECEVFNGADKMLNDIEKIFVELHFCLVDSDKMKKTLILLKKKKFKLSKIVLEWQRNIGDNTILGNFCDYLYKKRSVDVIYDNITIDDLLDSDLLDSHLAVEAFFEKENKIKMLELKNE